MLFTNFTPIYRMSQILCWLVSPATAFKLTLRVYNGTLFNKIMQRDRAECMVSKLSENLGLWKEIKSVQ